VSSYQDCRVFGWGGVAVGVARGDAKEFVREHAIHFALVLLGIAVGIEFGLDLRTLGPFPEEFFHFFLGAGFFEGEPLLFDREAFGGEIDPMRKDIRRFVPARMENLKVIEEAKFERPASFSVEKILKGSFGVFSGGSKLMKMKILFDRFAGQRVKERKWHQSQKIKEIPGEIGGGHLTGRAGCDPWAGGIELTLELSSFVEIVPWILSWGRHARVIAPKELVHEVKEEARQVEKAYG
jgi:hypothetical protein